MLNLINVTLTRMALISDAVGLRCANPSYETTVFLIKSKGRHPQLVNEANTGSLTLLPVFCSYKTYSNQLLEYCFAVLPG